MKLPKRYTKYGGDGWRRWMLVNGSNGAFHKTYERGSFGNVPQSKKKAQVNKNALYFEFNGTK